MFRTPYQTNTGYDRGNRESRKVRKRQHQNPEFGHTQGEIKRKPAKKVH
jgi:hypothetical protein